MVNCTIRNVVYAPVLLSKDRKAQHLKSRNVRIEGKEDTVA